MDRYEKSNNHNRDSYTCLLYTSPVLAHPCKIKGIGARESDEFKENFKLLLKELKKVGLKGLECIYPAHSDGERLFFIDMASRYHLHITEGSDFHGR